MKSDKSENQNEKAKELLEAALGGVELETESPLPPTGEQVKQELLERAKQKLKQQSVPESIKGVSFQYDRSILGSEPIKSGSLNSLQMRQEREQRLKKRLERFGDVDPKSQRGGLSGRGGSANSSHRRSAP